MSSPEPEPTAREIAQRTRSRLPSSQTGSERRISDALVDALAPELHSLHRRIGGVEQRLSERIDGVEDRLNGRIDGVEDRLNGRIDGLDAKIDRLGEHVIDRLGDMDAKLDRLLSRSDEGRATSG